MFVFQVWMSSSSIQVHSFSCLFFISASDFVFALLPADISSFPKCDFCLQMSVSSLSFSFKTFLKLNFCSSRCWWIKWKISHLLVVMKFLFQSSKLFICKSRSWSFFVRFFVFPLMFAWPWTWTKQNQSKKTNIKNGIFRFVDWFVLKYNIISSRSSHSMSQWISFIFQIFTCDEFGRSDCSTTSKTKTP